MNANGTGVYRYPHHRRCRCSCWCCWFCMSVCLWGVLIASVWTEFAYVFIMYLFPLNFATPPYPKSLPTCSPPPPHTPMRPTCSQFGDCERHGGHDDELREDPDEDAVGSPYIGPDRFDVHAATHWQVANDDPSHQHVDVHHLHR